MKLSFHILILLFFLSGCLRYKEEWKFNKDGSGTVNITCEPSPNWQNFTKVSSWGAVSTLFLPNYLVISQSCANAGITVEKCKYKTKKKRPKIDIILSFKSLKRLSGCDLFSDRILQWQREKLKSVFFCKINLNQDHFSTGKTSFADKNWLKDGSVEFIINFPDKVYEVKGASQQGKKIIAEFPLSDFVEKKNITISAAIKTFPPIFQWIVILISLIFFLILVFLVLRKWYNTNIITQKKEKIKEIANKQNKNQSFHGQYW